MGQIDMERFASEMNRWYAEAAAKGPITAEVAAQLVDAGSDLLDEMMCPADDRAAAQCDEMVRLLDMEAGQLRKVVATAHSRLRVIAAARAEWSFRAVHLRGSKPCSPMAERNRDIERRHAAGESADGLAKRYGISRSRVFQILGLSRR